MSRFSLFLPLCLLLVAVIGCQKSQTMKDSWKFTTRQYRTYLNTPASVDLADKGSCEVYELALGEAVLAVDMELQKLIRAMENSDHNPDQRWVMSMMDRFPWLSGVALVEGSGALAARYPEYFAKNFDVSPLLVPDPKQRPGALRAYAQPDPAGAEIYLANPVFGDEELKGLIVAYFDIRALATLSADPGSFAMASPVGVLWPGSFGAKGGTLDKVDWDPLLKEKSCGLIGPDGSQFFWTTRYLGNLPLVYAMPASATPAASEAQASPGPGAETAMPPDAPSSTPLEETPQPAPDKASDAPDKASAAPDNADAAPDNTSDADVAPLPSPGAAAVEDGPPSSAGD
jgi:hypothetical protein